MPPGVKPTWPAFRPYIQCGGPMAVQAPPTVPTSSATGERRPQSTTSRGGGEGDRSRCGITVSAISERTVSSTIRSPRSTVQIVATAGVVDEEASTAAATEVAAVHWAVYDRMTAAQNVTVAPPLPIEWVRRNRGGFGVTCGEWMGGGQSLFSMETTASVLSVIALLRSRILICC